MQDDRVMKLRIVLFIVFSLPLAFVNAQSQMIKGTVKPISEKQGILFLPVAEKTTAPEKVIVAEKKIIVTEKMAAPTGNAVAIKIKESSRNVRAPFPDISRINLYTTTLVSKPDPSLNPLVSLDTMLITRKSNTESIPVKSNLLGQTIKGVVSSKPGVSTVFEPLVFVAKTAPAEGPVVSSHILNSLLTPVITVSPLDFLDTSAKRNDFVSSYSTPPVINNLKAQTINGSVVAIPGAPQVIEPVAPDTLLARAQRADELKKPVTELADIDYAEAAKIAAQRQKADNPIVETTNTVIPVNNTASSPVATVKNKRSGNEAGSRLAKQNIKGNKNKELIPQAPAISNTEIANKTNRDYDTKYNFFVNQYGKFSTRISSNYFYLNITQSGKLTDYAILADGQSAGSNNHTTQLGKTKITFDKRGWIETIAGEELSYTYDGRVNKVGNIYINYDNEGKIIKVGNIDIYFNSNSTVDKFANFRVGYIRRRVIGIDDSNGLVIYRPVVEDDNRPNF